MDLPTLRLKLATANLSHLAAATNIHVRTIRRIKNGQSDDVKHSTMEALSKALARKIPAMRAKGKA